jgi:hypothetical protein
VLPVHVVVLWLIVIVLTGTNEVRFAEKLGVVCVNVSDVVVTRNVTGNV